MYPHQVKLSSKKSVMINLSQLNKLIYFSLFFTVLIFNICFSEDEPADIWKKQDTNFEENNKANEEKKTTIESPILSSDENTSSISIAETELEENKVEIVGLFDPQENDFNLGMWMDSDGNDVKKTFSRINKLRLSNFSEDLLFKILFTNLNRLIGITIDIGFQQPGCINGLSIDSIC